MNEHLELVIDMWTAFEDEFPVKKRLQLAERYLQVLENNGIDCTEITELPGNNKYIDKAMEIMYPLEHDDEDYD